MNTKKLLGLAVLGWLCAAPAWSQQTGSISGRVTSPDGEGMPGVSVQAAGDVLPQPQTTETGAGGAYRFPLLPPGNYTLTFSLEGMNTETRSVRVSLDANTALDVTMAPEALAESIDVVAEASLVDTTSTELRATVSNEVIEALPVGQDYRDLQKLIPGVQYSELGTRGPSAGGSGQDNVYLYDGVNVNLPLFGTLSAEPSTHDVDQVSVVKGGAKALDFNRAAGFSINTISKSGTNAFRGEVSYKLQSASMTSDLKNNSLSTFDEDQDWTDAGFGGPILRDKLFFYTSYYRPTVTRDNRANVYGPVADFESTRDEFFGRLSFQPTSNVLIHGSYRDSDRSSHNASVGQFTAASASTGNEATLGIGILEASWVINSNSYVTFKYNDFENKTSSRPDNLLGLQVATDGSVKLDVTNPDTQGLFAVPKPVANASAYNAFIASYIAKYGFLRNGVREGGGLVGVGSTVDNDDFFRTSYQAGYNWSFGQNVAHDLHLGYQQYTDEEDLDRSSNGWGSISLNADASGNPFFQAVLWQQGVRGEAGDLIPVIHSEFKSQNVEVNDTVRWGNWSFNGGVLLSDDKLYGQGLRENKNNVSGYEICITCKYEMYHVKFGDQIQPRLGAIWAYNGSDTVFASYARYNPAANSLPRAASWARSLGGAILEATFDTNGNLISSVQRASSSGKFFVPDLDPRSTDEYVIGTARQFSPTLNARFSGRYRRSYNFWEDTNNNARQFANAPDDISHELYIPRLNDYRADVGGSTYVIAELDNAFTNYYELSAEADWRGRHAFVRGSYVWSHYYGNFDQDNTSGDFIDNDFSAFIGSSNIADGAGRQVWDMKYGNLHGDRRHQLKVYGYYNLSWNATAGAFAIYQSGHPWETWDVNYYRSRGLTTSTSNTIRFSEPAGSHRTDAHYQLDLNYTQNFKIGGRFNIQLRGDVFNAFDKQTGYAIQPNINAAGYGEPTEYYRPRRFQAAVRFQF